MAHSTLLSNTDNIEKEINKEKISGGALKNHKIVKILLRYIPIRDLLSLNSVVSLNKERAGEIEKLSDTCKDSLVVLLNSLMLNLEISSNSTAKEQIESTAKELIYGILKDSGTGGNSNKNFANRMDVLNEEPLVLATAIVALHKDAIIYSILEVVNEIYKS